MEYSEAIEHLRILLAERDALQTIREILLLAKTAKERQDTLQGEYDALQKKKDELQASYDALDLGYHDKHEYLEETFHEAVAGYEQKTKTVKGTFDQYAAEMAGQKDSLDIYSDSVRLAIVDQQTTLADLKKHCESWEKRLEQARTDYATYKAKL